MYKEKEGFIKRLGKGYVIYLAKHGQFLGTYPSSDGSGNFVCGKVHGNLQSVETQLRQKMKENIPDECVRDYGNNYRVYKRWNGTFYASYPKYADSDATDLTIENNSFGYCCRSIERTLERRAPKEKKGESEPRKTIDLSQYKNSCKLEF